MVTTKDIYQTFDLKDKIEYKLFFKIIDKYNEKIIDSIIEGETFDFGFAIGLLSVIEKERKVHSIKWKESLEKKQRLIEEGRLPLAKLKDSDNKIIGDNGGEEWMIYNMKDSVLRFYWNRHRKRYEEFTLYPLRRIRRYHLKITKNVMKKLNRVANEKGLSYANT